MPVTPVPFPSPPSPSIPFAVTNNPTTNIEETFDNEFHEDDLDDGAEGIAQFIAGQIQEGKMEKIDPVLLKGEDIRYDTSNDATMRLHHTIIHFEGQPFFIKEVFPDKTMRAWDMSSKLDVLLNANDARLDVSSPKIGFIKYKDYSVYPMRTPARQQRQGLEPGRLAYFDTKRNSIAPVSANGAEVLKQFRHMLLDEYPNFDEAQDAGFPVSKNWAFSKTKDPSVRLVYHKAYPVAFFFPTESRFIFRKGGLTRFRQNSLQKVLDKKGDYSANYHIEEFGS